jgi:hypothetical protein
MNTSWLIERVRESNRQAADACARWASHRSHVMGILRQLPSDLCRICLLGAGHLHDVVLPELAEQYREIILVDVDESTVTAALTRTEARARKACRVMPATDLTGILERLERVQTGVVSAYQVISALATHQSVLSGSPFDVTVSLGLLTQMLQAIVDTGFAPDEVPRVSIALRDKHLRDLVRLTRPGGRCVLVTDIVSSRTAPRLPRLSETELEAEMASLVATRNFFTGTNPYRIVAVLERDPAFRKDVCDVRLFNPWLWAVTPDRHHLTCAILAARRSR